jgi:hypothetical protein
MAVGLGIVLVLIGWALLSVAKAVAAMTTAEPAAAPA